MMLLHSRVIALSPSGQGNPSVVVAGSRAGGLGVFDYGLCAVDAIDVRALEEASRYLKDRPFGLRLDSSILLDGMSDRWPANLRVLIVAECGGEDWSRLRSDWTGDGRTAMAEVTSRESALAATAAGFDAVIVAGNEAGGRGGEDSTFILLQAVLALGVPRVWVRGGIGPRAASACVAAGAAGVVLDGALLLARECSIAEPIRDQIARWDGGETVVIGRRPGGRLRVQAEPGSPALGRLKHAAAVGIEWDRVVQSEVGWGPGQARPVGQDAALAARLARTHVTVGGIVQAVERAIDESRIDARRTRPLAEGSPLAQAHGTRYPVVQGPMTRVSDLVPFAEAVADGGGLPFLALALMRGEEAARLLDEASARLDGRAWGVGVLGFVPPELRREQIAEIRRVRPRFALIAGGRPDQARELEQEGIATYLHAPSPGLLSQFWNDGARRFVLEGRECGGHVGPRSSLLLWQQGVEVILDALERGGMAEDVHLLFAGGIHDARSAAAVAALGAPLARRGAKVGVLIGTAYLFTAEAVATGAILPGFQTEALKCRHTVLLETGPGHEVRVSPTAFVEVFEQERKRLLAEGRSAEVVRIALENLNAGRLRIAAKGITRSNGAGSALVAVGEQDQLDRGLYMLGQAATLRHEVTTIAELHREICAGATERIERLAAHSAKEPASRPAPSDVAIIGMAAIVPGAGDVRTFWENTLRGHDAITEVPEDRWDWRLYYDPEDKTGDKITSKWGGFVPDVPFNPLRYGMPPASLPSVEPMQLLTLEAVRAALEDAGYRDRPFPRERTAMVLGAGGGAAQLAMGYAFRSYLPLLDTVAPGAGREALERAGNLLPEWTEDSFPGILLNVAAGRVANRFDLGGANYTVDAACGSSLAAASVAVRELESGAADMVILGGADTVQNPFTYLAFSKTHAFSPKGRCRPFDDGADGIVISEAVAVVVLKRLADAERDGDRIYAVLKGLGASSDGRAKGLTAPRPEGQVSALRRAYGKAGVDPATVGYVEAHGTGTAAGDLAEVQALSDVFEQSGAAPLRCALGSVKSLVGHTKCAAGLVGMINATLALHHKVLPPTIGVTKLNRRARLDDGPFHVSTKTRPWLHADPERPRRAGVSAFGFGGTNFHAVLEAYEGAPAPASAPVRDWPAELLCWRAADRTRLAAELDRLSAALERGAPSLRDLAHTLLNSLAATGPALAIVATSVDDLRQKLSDARAKIAAGSEGFHDARGIDFAAASEPDTRVAFLFPGQGAQRPEMLGELAVLFPEVRAGFESFDAILGRLGRGEIGPRVFPPPAFSDEERERQRLALAETDVAQPALGAACVGMLQLLTSLGVVPEMVAGHSYGELVALHAAGVLSLEALVELSEARGRFIKQAAGEKTGAMAALAAGPDQARSLLEGLDGVAPVNWNGPRQTVISGTQEAVGEALARARRAGVRAQCLPVSCAFHSPMVAGASAPLADLAARLAPAPARLAVFSNTTAARSTSEPEAIARQLGEHLASPVRFAEMVEAMYTAGARTFVEVGPGGTLTSLVDSILNGRPHLALASDPGGRPGVPGLLHTLGRLFVAGVPLSLARLTAGRSARILDRTTYASEPDEEANGPSTWLVNGTRARPIAAAEPKRLGPGPALPIPRPHAARVETHPQRNGHLPPVSKNGNGHVNGHIHAPAHKPAPEPIPGVDRVVEAFQKTMQTFLEVQRDTMLALLGQGSHGIARPIEDAHPGTAPRAVRPAPVPSSPYREEAVHTNGHAQPASKPKPPEPPSAERPAPVAPPEPPANGNGTIDVAAKLLAIVRDRTGYPAEMLRLDLDLEADLGIDSIKRVEILGSLKDALPAANLGSSSDMMDQLSRARTLGAIVERVERSLSPNGKHGATTEGQHGSANGRPAPAAKRRELDSSPIKRMTLRAVDQPLSGPLGDLGLARGGLVLITDDRRGIARALAADLRAKGHPVVVVGHAESGSEDPSEGHPTVDLTSPVAVDALLERLRARGPLAAVIHLLPLQVASAAGLDRTLWSARMAPEVHGLFLLARGAAEDLARAAAQGGACLIACTAMGGGFASLADGPDDFFAGHGAIGGMLKTLAREWPSDVRVRVVDLDPSDDVELLAANLVHEVGTRERGTEVGYIDRRRIALRVVEEPLSDRHRRGITLAPAEPVIVTGGARGITAAVAADMAGRWRPTLLLLGTSPLPLGDESPSTAGVTCPATLKSILHQGLSRESTHVGPAELERAYQALRRQREIRANLERLRAAGSHVEYASVDVRDAEALRRIVGKWQGRFGPIRGLVHGAGVIQDKLLRDKTPESFERVLGTKLDGALNLAAMLDPEQLRFAAFFSSVAGRFGNRGQADYAAANEALNKLALWLDRRWSCRVVSVIWGPWSGVGMVSDLEGHLGRRGLGMIDPAQGAHRLSDELVLGRKGDVEVVIAGEIGPLLEGNEKRVQAAHAPDLEADAVAVS